MIKRFFIKIKSKKGASTVEFTYTMLLFLMLLISGLELFMMGYKYITVSDFANGVASTIAVQGGLRTTSPNGYNAGGSFYTNSYAMMNSVDSLSKKIGQPTSDISIRIKYQPAGTNSFTTTTLSSSSNIEIPYGNSFEVTVSYIFRLQFLNQIAPISDSITVEKTKGDVSQFEYNYD